MDPYNEGVKMFATALNNPGVGAILAGFVAPVIRGELSLPSVLVWGGIGVTLIAQAQLWLAWRLR